MAEGAKAAGNYHYQIYANEFVSPEYLLAKNFSDNTRGSQATIVEWADLLASEGPWCTSLSWLYFYFDSPWLVFGFFPPPIGPGFIHALLNRVCIEY